MQLTLRDDLQRVAAAALGEQRGAVIALDPDTGAILALVSHPGFDPNVLATGDPAEGNALDADPDQPLLNRAIAAAYPPGSSFKVLVAAAALATGDYDPGTELEDRDELALPGSTAVIRNSDEGFCGDGSTITLERALAVSCNTAFAALGMEIGAGPLLAAVEAAGFNGTIPFDFPTAASVLPMDGLAADLPALAQTALGQRGRAGHPSPDGPAGGGGGQRGRDHAPSPGAGHPRRRRRGDRAAPGPPPGGRPWPRRWRPPWRR